VVPDALPSLSHEDHEHMQFVESVFSGVGTHRHPPISDSRLKIVSGKQDAELWPCLSRSLNDPVRADEIRNLAMQYWNDIAQKHGWAIHQGFCPDQNWLTYGEILAQYAFLAWKLNRYHNEPPPRHVATNAVYDLRHLAYVAICDGILSNDKTLLSMAWACWAGKRDGILRYDERSGKIVAYRPPWQEQSQNGASLPP
jgi:hypothetical protein